MSFVVIHADRVATIATDDPVIPAADLTHLAGAAALLDGIGEMVGAARADGFEAGRVEGRAAGEDEMRGELFRLAHRDGEASRERQAQIARLAIEVVRRIAGEIGDAAMVAGLAERAAAQVAPDIAATIRVSPAVVDTVRARLAGHPDIAVEPDATLGATDCVVDTALGQIRGGLDVQLAQIERAWEAGRAG